MKNNLSFENRRQSGLPLLPDFPKVAMIVKSNGKINGHRNGVSLQGPVKGASFIKASYHYN